MLSRLVRGQLVAFAVVTVLAVGYITANYVGLSSLLGFGGYRVSVELYADNGLYPKALVTYRGVDVGTVEELKLRHDGITAELRIDDDVTIPADVMAEVHSTSAIGEQYVNLVPQEDAGHAGPVLEDGDIIPVGRTTVPVSTTELLEAVDSLVDSVPQDSLRTTVNELYKAFNGSSDDLQRLLDSGLTFQKAASKNLHPTLDLIDSLAPVLDTQQEVAPQIKSFSGDLRSFAGQLARSDSDLRATINSGPQFAKQVTGVFDDLRSILPTLMADLASSGRVLEVYLPGIEHILIVYPAVIQSIQVAAAGPPAQYQPGDYDPLGLPEAAVNFKLGFNAPPICVQGFEYAKNQRDPNDLDPAPLSDTSYCKVPADDPRDVRGSRNLPCPNNPDRRSPDAAGCGLIFPRFGVPGHAAGEQVSLAPPQPRKTAAYDPATGRVMAPNGQFYLLADAASSRSNPTTWQALVKAPLGL